MESNDASIDWQQLIVEPEGQKDLGRCDCCANTSSRVWGFVHDGATTLASYYVTWTPGQPGHGANWDLLVGRWGDGATNEDRAVVALEYRVVDGRGAFMVIDAEGRRAGLKLVSRWLSRADVVGTAVAATAFAVCDAIWWRDDRIAEMRTWR